MSDTTLFERRPGETPYRNPDRIRHMCNLLYAAWCMQPDTRMGQLIMNAAIRGGGRGSSLFNTEEEVFAQGLLHMIKEDEG